MSEAAITGYRELSLASLVFSKSPAQSERRRTYDKSQMKELVENIKVVGVIQPIVVRPGPKAEQFEVIAGERRATAAREAGLASIPTIVRVLTDEQALDVNLIENLQRQALHELVECEGFEDLKSRGQTVEQIAAKVGKSASYVYKRLELAACGPDLRKAFFDGTIDASKALFLSRLQGNDLQKKALKDVLGSGDMSFRRMVEYVRRAYMQRLDQATFKTDDASLVPAAGPCTTCPHNSAASIQAGLFGDVSNEDASCSNGKCFQQKTDAATAVTIKAAEEAGRKVLRGKDALKALSGTASGYSRANYTFQGDSQYRSYEKVLGKHLDEVAVIAVDPESGESVTLVDKDAARKLAKDKGIKLSKPAFSSSSSTSKAESAKAKAEREKVEAAKKVTGAVLKAIHEKVPKPLTDEELCKVADWVWDNIGYIDLADDVFGAGKSPDLSKLNAAGLLRVIRTCVLMDHAEMGDHKVILAAAKRHGVNVDKIKAELAPKPVPAAAKSATKKAAKKK
jgi:ParB/RepB/Spo0J family partition protein